MFFLPPYRKAHSQAFRIAALGGLSLALFLFTGCSREKHHTYVYVSAPQAYLHDRVAAVSNRVAEVKNGDQLELIQHGKRFLQVRTGDNRTGWIEEHAVVDEKLYDEFQQLAAAHKGETGVATAATRDDVYLHIKPGRESDHLYLLPGNAKVQLLRRATAVKTGALAAPPPPPAPLPAVKKQGAKTGPVTLPTAQPADLALEDWWLVRDANGHTGWLLAGRVDVDVPDEIGIFAECQRIIGAYVIAKVSDPKSTTPDHMVPEYVTLMAPPKPGLPFDFDQVRVFTWSTQRHRYETAYRLHPISGYLPMKLGSELAPEHKPTARELAREQARLAQHKVQEKKAPGPVYAPTFTIQIANGTAMSVDPETGTGRPTSLRSIEFQLVDTRVERIGADRGPIPVTHAPGDTAKSKRKPAAHASHSRHRR